MPLLKSVISAKKASQKLLLELIIKHIATKQLVNRGTADKPELGV